ncbi:MAG: hypothetical protein WBG43_08905 [Marinifilaceae bacterium]
MHHLKEMHWDCSENLSSVDLDEAGNKAFYVCDEYKCDCKLEFKVDNNEYTEIKRQIRCTWC